MELALRQRVADALRTQNRSALGGFAEAINKRTGDRMPCWGDIADVVAATIPTDEDAIALWTGLLEVGEPRALAIVFDALASRPRFLEAVVAHVGALPTALQCGLATVAEVRAALGPHAADLGPAARERLAMSGDALVEERAIFDAFVGGLRAQRAGTFPVPAASSAPHPEASEALPSGDHP
jgi:hypothetical protein